MRRCLTQMEQNEAFWNQEEVFPTGLPIPIHLNYNMLQDAVHENIHYLALIFELVCGYGVWRNVMFRVRRCGSPLDPLLTTLKKNVYSLSLRYTPHEGSVLQLWSSSSWGWSGASICIKPCCRTSVFPICWWNTSIIVQNSSPSGDHNLLPPVYYLLLIKGQWNNAVAAGIVFAELLCQ